MQIEIQSFDFTAKQELKSFVLEKVNILSRYYSQVIGSEIFRRLDNSHTKENKVRQIRLAIPGNDLLATAQCETFEKAILKVVKLLKRQVQKLKIKQHN